ncbi:hypothetical protein BD626DRAFT_216981 [Schizophyllum amplum]|uniref:Uncharacterized protein n=1 Tax=Schizophyllum amplum TaxID=97359 RepID=A0A550CKN3_9AGAR|nr:hypothetical protein BD626DRAFT_216981 [Auriculariopsis ampla]
MPKDLYTTSRLPCGIRRMMGLGAWTDCLLSQSLYLSRPTHLDLCARGGMWSPSLSMWPPSRGITMRIFCVLSSQFLRRSFLRPWSHRCSSVRIITLEQLSFATYSRSQSLDRGLRAGAVISHLYILHGLPCLMGGYPTRTPEYRSSTVSHGRLSSGGIHLPHAGVSHSPFS